MAEAEKSLGKKLLGFFIKEPENEPAKPVTQPGNVKQAAPPPPEAKPTVVSSTSVPAEVDRKFVEHFAELLGKANLPGPDYFEFKQALKSMEGLGLNEEKQFQASWASFKAMAAGVTETSVLTNSANHYGNVLNKDRESFLKDVEKAVDDRIGSLKQESKKLQEATKSYAQQIVDLQKKIDGNNDRLEKINGEIQEQTDKINVSRDSFDLTYQSMVDQINADVEKIKRYLG
ncbi:hypothetical protein [Persicitalea sp.]|uniref:hypothetical protein n=1 Tax=Persicitalea sp. TaxID=3100273 RepID=UPI003593B55C